MAKATMTHGKYSYKPGVSGRGGCALLADGWRRAGVLYGRMGGDVVGQGKPWLRGRLLENKPHHP